MNYEIEYYDKDGDYMEKNFSRKDSALKFMKELGIVDFHMYRNDANTYKEELEEAIKKRAPKKRGRPRKKK